MMLPIRGLSGLFYALSGVLLVACSDAEPPAAPPPPAVEIKRVSLTPVATELEFVARTRAMEDTQIRARITGTIVARDFSEGQAVEEGALLYEIDPRPYQSALTSAQAALKRAESAASVAAQNWQRGQKLVDDGYISAAEMDKLAGERDGTAAALEEARAAIEKAELDLGFTRIVAPFDGVAGRSELSIGDLVDPSAGTLVNLVKADPMLVDIDVNERAIAEGLQNNQQRADEGLPPIQYTPRLKLVTGAMYPHDGEIDYLDNRVNASTGTITVTARFPNPDGVLVPGQFVRVLVQRGEREDRLLIPQASVLEDMQGRYVFIVGEGEAVERRNITLGQREGINWVVEDGLQEGDRVIVNGIQKVRTGMVVQAREIQHEP